MRPYIVFSCGLVLAGCSGDEPSLEIVSASPEALVTADDAQDDLTIVLRYEDTDGDLGGGIARVHDCRSDAVVTDLELAAIADEEGVAAEIAVSGQLRLLLADVGGLSPGRLPEACASADASAGAFCVVLVDAAGNESEPACTAQLRLE
jgi:hypothetical protein